MRPEGRRPLPGHLGEEMAGLVDGELSHDARDRALAHVAECDDCLTALEAQRRLAARLRTLGDPEPPPGLSDRLAALPLTPPAGTGELRRLGLGGGRDSAPPAAWLPPDAVTRPEGSRPGVVATPRRPRGRSRRARSSARRRVGAAAGGALTATGVALTAAFLVGPATGGAAVTPPMAALTTEHASTGSGLPLADPARGAVALANGGYGGLGRPVEVSLGRGLESVTVSDAPRRPAARSGWPLGGLVAAVPPPAVPSPAVPSPAAALVPPGPSAAPPQAQPTAAVPPASPAAAPRP